MSPRCHPPCPATPRGKRHQPRSRVLAAEVVKFFFPSLVELHSFVPTSSTAQKVANWGHLNRKVLSKLNLRLPEEMIQALVRSQPGTAEQLLQLLRDKILRRQRNGKGGAGKPPAESAALDEGRYLDTGQPRLQSDLGRGCSQDGAARAVTVAVPAPPGAGPGDMRQQLAEREQALQLARDTIQILQAKVERKSQIHLFSSVGTTPKFVWGKTPKIPCSGKTPWNGFGIWGF
ncbi:sperm flagellar protein 1 isoform X3 [Agelaius tricolor]|uniref:sperm flagellar protein 1 isoform X3 n=1 Tax=Agelaius tricolor TaxID=9191 RepID=UPI0039F24ADD